MLSRGRVRAYAIDAHELALTEGVTAADQVVVVSHRGTKQRPNEVLRAARDAGAYAVAVTGHGPAAPEADVVLRTVEQERASTHTVSYTAALAVLGRIVAALLAEDGEPLLSALRAAPDAVRRTLDLPIAASAVEPLTAADPPHALVAGSGLDALTAREAALKLKEGTYRWAEGMGAEFALHGTPAVFGPSTTGYVVRPAHDDAGRARELTDVLTAVGARVVVAGEEAAGVDLPFAPVPVLARPLVAIVPFQRLVSAVAVEVGSNPDRTRTEAEPWASAVQAVRL